MALVNLHLDEAAKTAVDEAAAKLAPVLDQVLEAFLEKLKGILVDRTITITIK